MPKRSQGLATPERIQPDLANLLATGPFDLALRAAIRDRSLTLDRLRARMSARGVPIGLSTLSDWQRGQTRPMHPSSLRALHILEEELGLPPDALTNLATRAGTDENASIISELLDALPGARGNDLDVLSEDQIVYVNTARHCHRIWHRMLVRARRDGVDRHVVRYFGGAGCDLSLVELTPAGNCRTGRVLRHEREPVMLMELLFGRRLRAGETWLFESWLTIGAGEPEDVFGHAFRGTVGHYLLEVRFDPAALPKECWVFTEADLDAPRQRAATLTLAPNHGVHWLASGITGGVGGIAWSWG